MSVELESDISIFNLPRVMVVFGSAEEQLDAVVNAKRIGAHGLQYAVVSNWHDRDKNVGQRLVASGRVHSFHQSFVRSGLAWLVMPKIGPSMEMLEPLEKAHARKFGTWAPLIVHPNEQYLGDKPLDVEFDYVKIRDSSKHGPLLHQPTVEVLERWNVLDREDPAATARNMLGKQAELGFHPKGVALDLHHIQARRGESKPLDLKWCIAFAGELAVLGALNNPGEVQMSIRPDFGGDQNHLAMAVYDDLPATPHGKMLQAVLAELAKKKPDDRKLRVTIEILPRLFSKREIGLNYVVGNRRIVQAMSRMALAA